MNYVKKVALHQRTALWQRTAKELLTEWAPPRNEEDTILDFGCGPGELSRLLSQGSRHVHGIDIDPEMIFAARRAAPKAQFKVYEGKVIPYFAQFFDRIYCMHVLGHVPDLNATVRELAYVLAPGGYLCVANPNKWNTLLRRPMAKLRGYKPDPSIKHRFSARELNQVACRYGLKPVKTFYTGEVIHLPLPANITHSMFLSYYRKD